MVGHMIAFGARLGHHLGLGSREGSRSRRRRLFDGSTVVILVSREGGAARESLLTICVGALVWSLAGVRASVASQGAAVAERLGTGLAVVWLLASMHTLVDGQSGTLNELLTAVRIIADMWPVSGVNALVASKIAAPRESFATSAARVGLDRLLGRLGLLGHRLHRHARHVGHAMHIGKAGHLHRARHRVRDV